MVITIVLDVTWDLGYDICQILHTTLGRKGTRLLTRGLRLLSDNKSMGVTNGRRQTISLIFGLWDGLYQVNYFAKTLGATRRGRHKQIVYTYGTTFNTTRGLYGLFVGSFCGRLTKYWKFRGVLTCNSFNCKFYRVLDGLVICVHLGRYGTGLARDIFGVYLNWFTLNAGFFGKVFGPFKGAFGYRDGRLPTTWVGSVGTLGSGPRLV